MNENEIKEGVRTVQHLAGYFEELKQTGWRLAEKFPNSERGYFTPLEEEEILQVLVSYWQSRNALFDLINSFRRDSVYTDKNRPHAFLTAFAAALILVDAGRFLREMVDGNPLLQKKLNDPAPQFGIPAGVYNRVQHSLLSTRHAWHLYHAIKYYAANEPQFRTLAARCEDAAHLMWVIDRLRHRVSVTVSQFTKAKLRARGKQVARWTSDLLFKAMYGVQKLAGTMISDRFVRWGHRPGLPELVESEIRRILIPGDVLVVRKDYALTNYFLPGYWPHTALFLGGAQHLEGLGIKNHEIVRPLWGRLSQSEFNGGQVLESLRDGVQIRSLSSPLSSDSIVILRPQISGPQLAEAIARGLSHEGKSYDYDFDFSRSDRLVCTEVIYRAFEGVGPIEFPLTRRAGRLTLTGPDLIHMGMQNRHFAPIAVYAPRISQELVLGSRVSEVIAACQPPA